jgi:hypothetical protein
MKMSDSQIRAFETIEEIIKHFGEERWFTQSEIPGAGYHTMEALVTKGLLKTQYLKCNKTSYYQANQERVTDGRD